MLIQPYIENAIIHGLAPKTENGKVAVKFYNKEDKIYCEVTDNGIGREKSAEIKQSLNITRRSMAMEITQKRLEILKNKKKYSINIAVEDLKESTTNSIAGTRVIFEIPMMEYKTIA